jgi:hypothetical protein
MQETQRTVQETRDGGPSGEQTMIDAASANDLSPESSHQGRLTLLTAIEWAHLGGD